jgi:hypothetical protein
VVTDEVGAAVVGAVAGTVVAGPAVVVVGSVVVVVAVVVVVVDVVVVVEELTEEVVLVVRLCGEVQANRTDNPATTPMAFFTGRI